ncbi:hypothetical protein ABB37_09667 [Leptomonas pyrrhocoris]|uniref:Uncharacterized protein n=1 Tax=Leptomonas pyrrhocoris TaxID=157538 RepID=A0A0M9FQD3_LEPPY|nr:hypothetical protein ABB37_09667 [Leptomonas pyrrhocoris]XP_015652219.1 hypothetical protein ABB37_09667 [Leptomonas pyrrhocoris]KPA73779.1 hypothetical protein ABB37_09667 [Leptomonas pyrrhocoris]KPA73780.1 hypothetical protein ABB37_09667 [Leptomonas pyrrhocoris]|eukprot:XP_015652218.1 hypothetical protein ABB37_09667 [Leptomonas pyrrhocoris]
MKTAPVRRARRGPSYFYRSSSASIEGSVRFGEGCVVLPHARISVPPGFVLDVGPFTLFADFAELHITTSEGVAAQPPPHSPAAATKICICSHNHFQSYASVRFHLEAADESGVEDQEACHSSPARATAIELLGTGNVFQPFTSVHARVGTRQPSCSSSSSPLHHRDSSHRDARASQSNEPALHPWQLGSFNVFTTHSRLRLPLPPAAVCHGAPATREEVGMPCCVQAEERRGSHSPPVPAMPPLDGADVHRLEIGEVEANSQAAAPAMSVEGRLFEEHSRNEGRDAEGDGRAVLSPTPLSSSLVAAGVASSPVVAASASASISTTTAAAPARMESMVYLSDDDATAVRTGAKGSHCTIALPRYGVRSVAELPTIIKRIIDHDETPKAERAAHSPSPPPSSSPLRISPAPSSPVAAAAMAAALANLEGYVDSVHPDLRAYAEQRVLAEAEQLCRFYIRQYVEETDLHPVAAQDAAD